MQMIPMAIGQAQQNAQTRNQGGQSGFLGGPGAIDGSGQSFWNLADPANFSGKASSGHILANIDDPGNVFGQNQAANPLNGQNAGAGSLPNLGAASLIPKMPGGAFQQINNGSGPYNAMAAAGAGGMTFNPAAPNHPMGGAANPPPAAAGGKPTQGMQGSYGTLPQRPMMNMPRGMQ